jgi:serine/threonine-protein kinase
LKTGARGVGDTQNRDNDSAPVDRVGQTLDGRYLVTGELGRGATGVVWEGRDLTNDQPVAIKVLHDALLPSLAARKRFHRELVTAASLDHPHTIRVIGDGSAPDGADYLVMERVTGRTLAAVLRECGSLPQLRAIRIIAQVLDATAAAHRLGVVHRDLKPANVMLVAAFDQGDFAKVCDYGLAKIVEMHEMAPDDDDRSPQAASFSTIQGMMCGTPSYMSPEQARGEPLDGRTDLYAIGVMLFHMVVGRLPFEARTPVDIVSAHLSAPPPRPRALRPDLDIAPALEGLILRAMSKDRRERPSSAEVMRADLLQVERDLVSDARRRASISESWRDGETLPASGPAPRPLERAPIMRRGRGIAALALLAVGLVVLVARASRQPAPRPAAPQAEPIVAAVAPAPAPPPAPAPIAAPPSPVDVPRAAPVAKPRPNKAKASVPPAAAPVQPAPVDLLRRAEDALSSGRLEEARVLGLTAAEHQPLRPEVWEFMGRCYMRLGRPNEARTFYARYLALAPDGPNASFIRAIVSRGSGKRAE